MSSISLPSTSTGIVPTPWITIAAGKIKGSSLLCAGIDAAGTGDGWMRGDRGEALRQLPHAGGLAPASGRPLHNRDLLLHEPVQLIHQPIDPPVGCVDHPGEHFLLVCGLRRREAPVQVEHLLDEGDVGGVGVGVGRGGATCRSDGKRGNTGK